jgi:nitrogen regulatory protein P-II 1
MKRVEAIVRNERVRMVKDHLKELGIGGIILHASVWSKHRKLHLRYRGLPVDYDLIPAAKFELIVPDEMFKLVVKTIKENATTGEVEDGIIMVSNLDEAVEIPIRDTTK